MNHKISMLVLIFLIAGFASAQQSYQQGETYTKTFNVIPNQSATNGYLIYSVTKGMEIKYYNFKYTSAAIVKDVPIPITVTWTIPANTLSGTYVASAIVSDSSLVTILGSVSEPFYVGTITTTTSPPIECSTNQDCQNKYQTCLKVCSAGQCYSTGLGPDTYPNCGGTVTTTTPSVTTTTYCVDFGLQYCPDGKTLCPFENQQTYSGYCPVANCSKCPQQPNNTLVYIVGAIVLLIVIFSLLKHYKKI